MALRYFLKAFGVSKKALFIAIALVASNRSYAASYPPNCPDVEGLRLSREVLFLAHFTQGQQLTFVPESELRTGWMQVRYEGEYLQLMNQMPGVGLPTDIYDVSLEVIDVEARVLPEFAKRFARFNQCVPVVLFPGETSIELKIPLNIEDLPKDSRLRFRFWTSIH